MDSSYCMRSTISDCSIPGSIAETLTMADRRPSSSAWRATGTSGTRPPILNPPSELAFTWPWARPARVSAPESDES